METIFPLLSLDRSQIHWEDHLYDMTPVERVSDMYFKREDKFAPLGYGNINGSKLRQLIWQFARKPYPGVASGAVLGSPQHPMVALCAKHWGMDCVQITGGKPSSKPEEGRKHDMIYAAFKAGAEIQYCNPGYAATLNVKARELADKKGWLHIITNITPPETPFEIEAFHKVGSEQISNIPDDCDTILIPSGSCNSVTSVLYGVVRFKPKNLKRIVLFGIGAFGSKDPAYIYRRLQAIGSNFGEMPQDLFKWNFHYNRDLEPLSNPRAPYTIEHYNVNQGCGKCASCTGGYCEYNDLMPYNISEGIEFHPRYEGKTWHFMNDHLNTFGQYLGPKSLYWIIGSKPSV